MSLSEEGEGDSDTDTPKEDGHVMTGAEIRNDVVTSQVTPRIAGNHRS